MDRRLFLARGAYAALGAVGLSLVGCGRESEHSLATGTVGINDIQTYGGGSIPGGVLPKEFIESMTPVQLAIYEGSHHHTFRVGLAEYRELLEGQVVTLTSDRSSGHTHRVTVDPSNVATYDVGDVFPYDRRYGEGVLMATTLTHAQIMAARPVTLIVNEGSHRHNLMVSTQDLLALRAGVTIEKDTETVAGHSHPMRFDPDYRS